MEELREEYERIAKDLFEKEYALKGGRATDQLEGDFAATIAPEASAIRETCDFYRLKTMLNEVGF